MRKILRLFPMMLLCLCVLTACSSDDGDNNGDSNCKNGVYVINGHKFVDLGLPSGLLWAECNIGASEPEEAGYSYRWGEVEPINYDIEYKFKDGNHTLNILKRMPRPLLNLKTTQQQYYGARIAVCQPKKNLRNW